MTIAVPALIRPECQAIWSWGGTQGHALWIPLAQRAIGLQGFVTAAHNVKPAMSAIAAVRATT
jgi:hypothetical protein